jgi:hypothetical protein
MARLSGGGLVRSLRPRAAGAAIGATEGRCRLDPHSDAGAALSALAQLGRTKRHGGYIGIELRDEIAVRSSLQLAGMAIITS